MIGRSLAVAAVVAAGCASVSPQPDFDKTAGLISERTGVESVYSPQTDDLVAEKVDGLLANGLTIQEATQVALLNNRAFQSLFQEIGVSRAEVAQSALLTNPSVSLLLKFPEGGGRSNLQFGLVQQLVDLWQIPVRKKVAEAKLEQTVSAVAQQAVDLIDEVKAKYYRVLTLQRGKATVEESKTLVQKSLELATRQVEAGAASQLDVNLVHANVIDVDIELIALRRDLLQAEADLARVLGLSRACPRLTLSDDLPQPQPIFPKDSLLPFAIEQRFDVKVADFEVCAAEQELVHEYLKVFPNVTAGFELERTERRALPGRKILADTARESVANGALTAPTIQSRAERNLERRQIIDVMLGPSLEVTLPIWDQNQAQIAKARFRVLQKRKNYEDLLEATAHDVERAWVAADNAERLVRFYEQEALPQANKNVEGARQVFQAGQQSILAVIEAQESLISRRRAYVNALGDYAAAMTELERAVGGRLPEAPATQPASATQAAGR